MGSETCIYGLFHMPLNVLRIFLMTPLIVHCLDYLNLSCLNQPFIFWKWGCSWFFTVKPLSISSFIYRNLFLCKKSEIFFFFYRSNRKDKRKLCGVMGMSYILIVMVATQIYILVKTSWVYILNKCIVFVACKLYLNSLKKKKVILMLVVEF